MLPTNVSAKWDARYDVFDIKLGKPYHVSRHLIFNPNFGLRAGWIDQTIGARYSRASAASLGSSSFKGDNDFWGFGARAGLDTEWIIGKGWNLFGNIAGSLLFGKFEVEEKIRNSSFSMPFSTKSDHYQNVPNMEIQLGIAWNKYMNRNKCRLGVAAAYEFHQWWNQNNLRKFYYAGNGSLSNNDTVSRGDLTLNGFSLKLQLDI